MRPDALALRAFLDRAGRRLTWRAVVEGAAGGIAVAAVLVLAGWPARETLAWRLAAVAAFQIIGILISLSITRDRGTVVAQVERRVPESRNLLLTADELTRAPAEGYAASVVMREAARLAGRLDVAALFPARRALAAVAIATALWLFAVTPAASVIVPAARGRNATDAVPAIDKIGVTITPPAYAGRKPQTLTDPARIEVLEGSRIEIDVQGNATLVTMETVGARDTLTDSRGGFRGSLVADADGYVAVEPSRNGRIGTRRLIGLTVLPDARPTVKITAPGRDVFLRDGHQSLELAIDAGDDIGLASLKLHYTKVAGSGERFTFAEGELPISITRKSATQWAARATWRLDSLALEPGDMVVYRAIAADNRPGVAPTESDAFIAEVSSPGGQAAPGFAVDPEQERYAVSQQMVILKTERLLAKRATISAEDFGNQAQEIAVEQRKVRAEFVFMLGGELADAPDAAASITDLNEEQEAAGESDLLAGHGANAGHAALLRAIRAMSRASTALTTNRVDTALTHERVALTNLESAFSRARILLRALTTRERLDLSRRLTGSLTEAARETHPAIEAPADSRTTALRRALTGVASLAASPSLGADAASAASTLAERVLQADASSKPLQDASAQLASAATALAGGRSADARRMLDRAASGIVAALRGSLPAAPQIAPSLGAERLNGALTDALRRPGGQR